MGKAKRFNSYDSTVSATRNQTESFGQGRQNVAGYPSGFGMTAKGKTQNNKNVNTLSLQNGGELRGPIGFTAEVGNISATNVLDLTISGAATVKQVRGLIFVSSSTSATLDEIVGKKYNGQIVILTGISGQTAITITHGSGNAGQILCPGDVNYTLSNDESVILVDDVTAVTQSWRVISVSNATGSGGLSNIVEDVTPQLGGSLDNNGFSINMDVGSRIYFDGGVDTWMEGSLTSGRINVFNNTTNVTAFGTFGLLTTNITCSGITSNGDIDVNSNDIKDIAQLKFASTTVSPTGVGITSNSGWLIYNTEASSDRHWFKTDNTLAVEIKSDQVELQDGINLEFRESSSAPSGSANGAKLFAEDNGAGKTRLMVQFGSGVAQQIAIEP